MSCIVIVLWTCDLCGKVDTQTDADAEAYGDEQISYPEGWDGLIVPPEHRSMPNADLATACASCLANPDWRDYRAATRAGKMERHLASLRKDLKK